jgi:nitrite reductase/ring-hydroxylating ferredoxin subunit
LKKNYFFAYLTEIPSDRFLIREIKQQAVGAVWLEGQLLTLLNYCPHAGAPICRGIIANTLVCDDAGHLFFDKDYSVLRCPWHGWEFNLKTGHSVLPANKKLVFVSHEIIENQIFVTL